MQNDNELLTEFATPTNPHIEDIATPAPFRRAAINTSAAHRSRMWRQLSYVVMVLGLGLGSVLGAYGLRYTLFNPDGETVQRAPVTLSDYFGIACLYSLILLGVLLLADSLRLPREKQWMDEVVLAGGAAIVASATLTMLMLLVQPNFYYSRLVLIYLAPVTLALRLVHGLLAGQVQSWRWRHGLGVRNLMVVGATDIGIHLMRSAATRPGLRYRLVGYIDDQLRYSVWTLPPRYGNSVKRSNREVPHLGTLNQLGFLLKEHAVHEVLVALPLDDYHTVKMVAMQCREHGVSFTLVPHLPEVNPYEMSVQQRSGLPVLTASAATPLSHGFNYAVKRTIDIVGALVLIALAAVPMAIVALAVKLDSAGPIIFRQTRIGKGGQPFNFYKFRSMCEGASGMVDRLEQHNETQGATFKMKADPRITKVGRFIRRTSLDELPQLFNVLGGSMSLVGPRPGLPRELLRYQTWHHRRLEVTPGITGLWQVNGRSSVSFDDMVKLDVYYIEHWSLWLDVKILLKTFGAVVHGDGAY